MYSEKNYLMIGNTRWHWASKIKEDWKYFHTSPNPVEFQDKDYSQLSWASVGAIPKNVKLCPSKKINIDDIYSQTSMNYPEVYRTEMNGETIKNLLEDVCDNIFNPDPFFQQGGDMVRVGGMTYTCQPKNTMGNRISDLKLSNGEKIESQKNYTIGGWGSINPEVEGPPIYKLLEDYVSGEKSIKPKHNNPVKIKGI